MRAVRLSVVTAAATAAALAAVTGCTEKSDARAATIASSR
jgi:iron uptake system component EfeO